MNDSCDFDPSLNDDCTLPTNAAYTCSVATCIVSSCKRTR